MNRIKTGIAVLLLGGLFSACGEKDYNAALSESNDMPHYVYTDTPTETKIFAGELLEDGKNEGSYEFTVKYGIPLDNTPDMEANVEIDNSLIEAYGKATSQSLQALPAEFISFSGGLINIPAGSRETKITFKIINLDKMPAGLYCVPVTIKSAKAGSGFSVHERKNTAYYIVTKGIQVLKPVTGMSVVAVSDEQIGDGNPKSLLENPVIFDGNPATFWHSQYEDEKGDKFVPCPHWVVIDMAKPTAVARIETVRRSGIANVKEFEYWINETTSDPNDAGWKQISTDTYLTSATEPHLITTDIASPQKARYLKLVVTSTYRTWPPGLIAVVSVDVYRYGY